MLQLKIHASHHVTVGVDLQGSRGIRAQKKALKEASPVSKDLTGRVRAGELVKKLSAIEAREIRRGKG